MREGQGARGADEGGRRGVWGWRLLLRVGVGRVGAGATAGGKEGDGG